MQTRIEYSFALSHTRTQNTNANGQRINAYEQIETMLDIVRFASKRLSEG